MDVNKLAGTLELLIPDIAYEYYRSRTNLTVGGGPRSASLGERRTPETRTDAQGIVDK